MKNNKKLKTSASSKFFYYVSEPKYIIVSYHNNK